MVFITSMLLVLMAMNWGNFNIIYAFIIALVVEVVNIVLLSRAASRAEGNTKGKYTDILENYKEREKQFEEDMTKLKHNVEELNRRLDDANNIIREKIRELDDKKKTVDQYYKKMQTYDASLNDYKAQVEKLELTVKYYKGER